MQSVLNTLSERTYFYVSKGISSYSFLLVDQKSLYKNLNISSGRTSYGGSKISTLTCSHRLYQLINEPTQLQNLSLPCVNLYSLFNQTLTWKLVFNTLLTQIFMVFTKLDISIYYPLLMDQLQILSSG